MAKDRRSRDQKRKDKLAKRNQNALQRESPAYSGNKYKSDKLAPLWLQTETAIYEALVMTDHRLLDQTVYNALVKFIPQLRAGTLPPPPSETEPLTVDADQEEDLVISFIRQRWAGDSEAGDTFSLDQRIGVLRSILGTMELKRLPGPDSQGYLRYLAGFLTRTVGVKVRKLAVVDKPSPDSEDLKLLQLGQQWTEAENPDAKADFYELADHLIKAGQGKSVMETCRRLRDETADLPPEVVNELAALSRQAEAAIIAMMG